RSGTRGPETRATQRDRRPLRRWEKVQDGPLSERRHPSQLSARIRHAKKPGLRWHSSRAYWPPDRKAVLWGLFHLRSRIEPATNPSATSSANRAHAEHEA